MKTLCTLISLLVSLSSIIAQSERPFITIWQTDNPGISEDNQILLNTPRHPIDIYWESLTDPAVNGSISNVNEDILITFPQPGRYRVEISRLSGFGFRFQFPNSWSDSRKLLSVEQWGDSNWTHLGFPDARNMVINATDAPDLGDVLNLSAMFFNCSSMNDDIGHWEVSNAVLMRNMFQGATLFNQDIRSWDVSNVVEMDYMFFNATAFNQNISQWDVSKVRNMQSMFQRALSFNQDIGDWDVSNVSNMWSMFDDARSFNQDIGNWDVSNVTNMSHMFNRATVFNQDIGGWDVSKVINMTYMFAGAPDFNQDIGNWNTASLTATSNMFDGARSFNQDISGWNMSQVFTTTHMFQGAIAFNQDLAMWDVSNVRQMFRMFNSALVFNQNLGDWDISSVTNMTLMLNNTALSIENYDNTLIGWANQEVKTRVSLGAAGLIYSCAGKVARDHLVQEHFWIVSGDNHTGENCGLLPITGITFEDGTFPYDGTEKTILIDGELPEGTMTIYEDNTRTEVGSQTATATISGDGYETLVLQANLEIAPAQITGISFEDATFSFDGTEKTLLISGDLPDGTSVVYENNTRTNAGTQTATATITGDNYQTLVLQANLEITPGEITGISFEDATFIFDGTEKTLLIGGDLPEGTTVTYENHTRTEVGMQTAIATISGANYQTLVLQAILTVISDEDCDGVADEFDLCPGGDDSIDGDEDGNPDCFVFPGIQHLPKSWLCGHDTLKVLICHNEQTICISDNAVTAHLSLHEEDYLGPCEHVSCTENLKIGNDRVYITEMPKSRFEIYPNPTSHIINLQFTEWKYIPFTIRIINELGRYCIPIRYSGHAHLQPYLWI